MSHRKSRNHSIWRNGYLAGERSALYAGVALGFFVASVLYAIVMIVLIGA